MVRGLLWQSAGQRGDSQSYKTSTILCQLPGLLCHILYVYLTKQEKKLVECMLLLNHPCSCSSIICFLNVLSAMFLNLQAVMYVLCFRLRSIMDYPNLKLQLFQMRIQNILAHPLEPLKVCITLPTTFTVPFSSHALVFCL